MPRISRHALAVVALALAACSPNTEWATPAHATLVVDADDAIDVHFEAVDLRPGEAVTADLGGARLTSTASGAERNAVRLSAPDRIIRAVKGSLDGVTAQAAKPSQDAGTTSLGPTSVHRHIRCDESECTEVVEFDYDLHAPDGDGTTSWRTPDGRSATIDRLRFELEAAHAQGPATLRLTTPTPATVVTRR